FTDPLFFFSSRRQHTIFSRDWSSDVCSSDLAVGSCGMGGPLGDTLSVDHDGSLYYVTAPGGYDETTAWTLIFGLHGDEGDPADSVNWFWRDVVNDSFLFVAPKAPNASGSWYEETESNSAWMD